MPKVKIQKRTGENSGAITTTDNRPPSTPAQLASRWHWHPESVRRALRERRIASIIVSRRRLIPASEIERIENSGYIARVA
jgi:hypothetical protein